MVDPHLFEVSPGLRELDAEVREALAESARETTFAAGERLVPLLHPPERILVLVEGLAKLVGVSANGIERIIYVFRPGEVTGSRILLEESPEAPYEIIAMQAVRAVAIGKREFLRVGERHPEVLIAVTREFSRRLNQLTARMLAAMSTEVPVRLSRLLLDFADGRKSKAGMVPLTYPLTHEAMAQIIGASRPHTSTVLRDLEEIGAVQRRSADGLLVHPDALERIVRDGQVSDQRAEA